MNLKRAFAALVVAAGMLANGAIPATAISDYPPSGPVILVSGDLIAGSTAQASVENCTVGESVRTTLASMPTVESICERADSAATTATATPLRGIARFDLPLPPESGVAAGEARLPDSGQTLSFALDVRSQQVSAVAADPVSSGLPGWPFLVLAGLVALVAMVVVSRRRASEATP